MTIEANYSVEVMSSFFTNTPCSLAHSLWNETIERQAAAQTTEKGTMFIRAWQLNLLTYALLADCSYFIAEMNVPTQNLSERRLVLLTSLDRLEQTWSERCEEKIRDVMGDDVEADLTSMSEKLSEATDFLSGRHYQLSQCLSRLLHHI